ncbi:MAG: [FeFe] hydrogenase, group A [Firmicutes bacterium]|nr:[FeFe] hydrogenase, group A [Bacillota bacterium]
MSMHLSPEIRVPIDPENPSIERHEDLCIRCGKCRDVCRDEISVLTYYDLAKTGDVPICIHCGQCANVCPVDSITEKSEVEALKAAIADPEKIVIVSTSPSVRVALGEGFGNAPGTFSEGKMVALLRKLGVDIVLDTDFAADMTIVEEASELLSRVTKKSAPLPQFTSCCPAWVKFAETYYPDLLPHISSAKSPIGMQGPTIKTWYAKKQGIDPKKIVNVCLTPCTAKKFEIRRAEMNDSASYWNDPDLRDMDLCITTRELIGWAKEAGIDYANLPESDFDSLMSEKSGGGVIFGATGGVMEAALRAAYEYLNDRPAPKELLQLSEVRGYEGIRTATVKLTDALSVRVAVIFGTANVRRFLEEQKLDDFDFIEVMTCPGGCIGGGGQPKHLETPDEARKERIEGLYAKDAAMDEKVSTRNQELNDVYASFYGKPLSDLAEKLLHTSYHPREQDLGESAENYRKLKKNQNPESDYVEVTKAGEKTRKWKCRICGYIYEGATPPTECPVCHQGADAFDRMKTWKCKLCGYTCEGVTPPDECPVCHQGADAFEEVKTWKCKICGYICEGVTPPQECPVCHQGADAFEEI